MSKEPAEELNLADVNVESLFTDGPGLTATPAITAEPAEPEPPDPVN